MPTQYIDVYSVFQSQIDDPIFNGLLDEIRDELSKQYLINSIPKFRRCLQNLNDRNDGTSTFNIDLIQDEIQILANLMVIEYMSSQIVSLKLIEHSMSTREFSQTSQASQLEKLINLKRDRQKDISKMIVDYSYTFSDLSKLK